MGRLEWIGYGLAVALLSLTSIAVAALELDDRERAWLAAHPKLPVLVDGDWPPIDYIDGEGHHRGVAAEYLHLISQALGIAFEVHPEPDIDRVLRQLASGEAPLAASIIVTDERRRRMRFTKPFLELHYRIVTRRDRRDVHRLDDLRGLVVAVEKGVFTESRLRHDFPSIRLKPVADTAAALKAVSWGEADAYVGNGEAAAWLIRQLGLLNLHIAAELNDEPAPLAFATSKAAEWQPLAGLINKALAAIPPAEHQRIERHWLSSADSGAHGFSLTAREKTWIARHPVIRIGTDKAWAPVEFQEDGKYKGMSADYVRLLNQRLGLNMRIVPGLTWEQVMDGIEKGDIDVVPAIAPLDSWRDKLLFTRPYLSFPFVVFTRADSGFIRGLDDLTGGRVVVEESTAVKAYLHKDYPGLDLLVVKSTAAAVEALALGRAEAYVGNLVTASAIAEQRGYTNIRVAAPTPYHYDLAFGVRKDWPELRDLLERGLDSIDEHTRREISERWLGIGIGEEVARRALRRQLLSFVLFGLPVLLLLLAWALTLRRRRNQLRAIEARFQQAMEAVSEGVWEWDVTSGHCYFSPGFFRVLGYRDSEIPDTEAAWEAMIHPADRDRRLRGIEEAERGGGEDGIARIEYRVRRRNGSWAPVLSEGRAGKRDATGRVLTRIGTLRDLSSLKSAQARVERLTRALEDNPLLILITDPNGRIDYVNGRIAELMHYQRDDVIGQPANRFLSPCVDPKALASLRVALARHERWRGELLHRRADGSDFWMAVSVSPIFDDHGNLTHFVSTSEDISERKAIEESLQRSERQLQQIIDAIPLAIIVVDQDGRIMMANPQAASEVSRETSLVGRSMLEFYAHAADRERFLALMARDGRISGEHIVFRTDWGELIDGLVSALPIQYGDRQAHLGVMLNLTERVRLEKALAEAKEAAESANRLKSRFLANMSHEIRTPLNAVIGLSHLALRTGLDAQQRDYLVKIASSGQSLLALINDILDLSRIEAGRMPIEKSWFSLDEVLSGVSGMVALKAAEKGLELLFSVACDVPDQLYGEPLRLGQVLVNLTQNAIKFTDAGEILIQVSQAGEDNGAQRLCFVVSDSGPGIAPEEQQRLFEPFTQARHSDTPRLGGVGLGLAISKSLVELMGGRIGVWSRPGQGASFHFTLPFEMRHRETPWCAPAEPFRSWRALIVDDNPVASLILADMLESFGVQADHAADGEQALALLASTQARGMHYALLFIDWRLPGMDGAETARRLREQADGGLFHLILVTAFGHQERIVDDGRVHWNAFLAKPFCRRQLFETLQRLEAGDRRESIAEQPPAWLARRLLGEVLVVEDNPINQQVARELLEAMGLTVTLAASGEAALLMLAERSWDLVLMDVEMPGIDGFETTRRIRAIPGREAMPIIAMTAHAITGDRERCLAAGMDDYISKPIDPRQLLELLAKRLPGAPQVRPPEDNPGQIPHLPRLSGMDCRAGLVQSGRNARLYRRLLQQFIEHHAGDAETLRGQLASASPKARDAALRLLHTLGGVAAHLGAGELSAQSVALGQWLRGGEILEDTELEHFGRQLETAIDAARACLDHPAWQELDDGKRALTGPGTQWNAESLEQLASALHAGSAEALSLYEQIGRDSVPPALYDDFKRLGSLVRDYEFNEAASVIDALRKGMEST